MVLPINRRTAFGGLAGAALTYGLAAEGRGEPSRGAGVAHGGPVSDMPEAIAGLRDRPSVRDKGAKGDGVAMDGAAIQDALQAFDTVWVPPGVYMIDVPLTIPSFSVSTDRRIRRPADSPTNTLPRYSAGN